MNLVVTGASTGIGAEVAKLYAEAGHTVFAISRSKEKLNQLADRYSGIIPVVADLSSEFEIAKAAETIQSQVDGVELLIHNAGHLICKPFEETTTEEWLDVYKTNVFGVVGLTKHLLPLLSKGKLKIQGCKSHILMVSSVGGVTGTMKFAGLSAYSSSKGAMTVLGECLAEEFKHKNIAVNTLALGSVDTAMFRTAFPGVRASTDIGEMGRFIADFGINGARLFNGKTIQVALSTP